jgi:Mn2+/Fe2+ NRAMP family transporter
LGCQHRHVFFGWKEGLSTHPGKAPKFYGIIALATLVGMYINFIGVSPVQALYWTAVINGFVAPVLLAAIMIVSNSKKIMGDRVNSWAINAAGWTTTALLAAAAVLLIVFWGRS